MERILKNNKREKGITLVALVVTIIVLLILAAIAISMIMGKDGIINKAEESKEETIKAQEREYIKLAYQDLEVEYKLKGTYITADRVMQKLSEYDKNIKVEMITKDEIGDTEIVVEKNSGEEYAEIVFTETEHKYAGSLVIDQNKARYEVTYNANRGSGGPTKQIKIEGIPLTITLEKPERKGYNFIGWARESTAVVAEYLGGSQYTEDANMTLYAVWQLRTDIDPVAQIGGTKYPSIQEAIYECSQETGEEKTTIILLKNTEEEFTTFEGQNIILDLQGHIVTSESEGSLCTNNGKLQIINGSLSSNKGTSILNNGEITIGDNSTGIDDNTPTIYGNKVGIDNKGTFNYYDGKIQGIVPIQGTTTSTPDQYGPVQTGYENGITTIQLRILTQYEARIGWVYYETLQGAIDIAKAKETVTLIKDIQLKEILQVGETKDVILDLYGYELTVAYGLDTVVKNYGNLEITDNSTKKTGNVTISLENNCYAIRNFEEGNVVLDNCCLNVTSKYYNSYGIYNLGEVVNINGKINSSSGNYTYSSGVSYGIYNNGIVELLDGNINCITNSNYHAYSYGIYNTTTGCITMNSGKIFTTGNSDGYERFGYSYSIYNKGNVRMNGGTISNDGTDFTYGIYNDGTGTIEINGGIVNSNSNRNRNYGIYNAGSENIIIREVTISNSMIDSTGGNSSYGIYNANNGNIKMTGGSIIISNSSNWNSYSYGIYNAGIGTIEIEKGTINSTRYGIYNKSTGIIRIEGGNVSSENYGIYNENSGSIIISKGTVSAYKYGIYNAKSGNIIIGNKTDLVDKISPIIIGTYLDSSTNYEAIGLYNSQGNIEFNNGMIQGDISLVGNIKKIREGYQIEEKIIEQKNSMYLMERKYEEIVQMNETKYYSLQEAINSIKGNEEETIELLKDFEINESIQFNKNIILDLKGYTITNKYYKMENTLNLTIIDTSEMKTGKIETTNTIYGIINKEKGNMIVKGKILSSSEYDTSYGIYNISIGTIEVIGGTVDSNSNNNNSYGIYNEGNGTIKINAGTVCSTNSGNSGTCYGIYNMSSGNVLIEDGLVSSQSYGIYNADTGIIEVINGIVDCSNNNYRDCYGIYNSNIGNITIKGGTVNGDNYGIYNSSGGTIKITGGTVNSGTIDGTGYGIYNYNTGNIIVEGGIVNCNSKYSYGIYNRNKGIVVIGIKGDGIISQEEPLIRGIRTSTNTSYAGYGVYNLIGELYFYDGIIEGTLKAVYQTITEKEENTEFKYNEDETILTLTTEKLPIAQIGDITYADLQDAIEATTEQNKVIKIIRNITYTNDDQVIIVPNNKDVILDLNGYKITSSITGKVIQNEGHLEITDTSENKDGMITTNEETTIYNINGAVLTISEGKIENKNETCIKNNGDLIIKNARIETNSNVWVCYGIYNEEAGNIIIKGGTIFATNLVAGSIASYGIYNESVKSITIDGGNIEGKEYGIYSKSGEILINSGIISSNNSYSNYGIFNTGSSKVTMNGGEIFSQSSTYANYAIFNSEYGIIEILKGKISSINTGTSDVQSFCYGIKNNSNGTVVVGKENQEEDILIIANMPNKETTGYGIYNNGILKIYDGTVKSTGIAIFGDITEIKENTELILYDEVIENKIYETAKLKEVSVSIAKANGIEYYSLQKAIEACEGAESIIEILNDSNQGVKILIQQNQNIVIDLKGYTINNYAELQNNGILKIIDTSEEKTGKIIGGTGTAISNTGTFEIKGGTISNSVYGIKNTGTITLNGGKITGNTYGIYNESNGIINIEQGNISSNTYGIYNNSNAIANINGGNISSNTYGIYNYSSSSITNINEGTITSNEYGVYNYNGTTNIGSKGITSNTYGVYVANGTVTVKEGAEIQSETGIYVSNGTLNIGETGTMNPDGPIIIGETYGLSVSATGKVYMYDGQIKGKTGATEGYITYTEEGYVVANKTEEEYFVDYLALGGTANAVAQVNGVSYSNLQSAINSITEGEEQTIILLNGIVSTETYTIAQGQNIKLDMNGKTITSEAEETINNSGNLTIIDTSGKNVAKITSTTGTAIVNSETLTLGEDEGTVTEGLITIEGETVGIENTGELNFYDGAVIGTTAINGEVKGTPTGYTITTGTVSGKQKATLTK